MKRSPSVTRTELVARIIEDCQAGKRPNLRGVVGIGSQYQNIDFCRSDLRCSYFEGGNFTRSTLTGVNLIGAMLERCNFHLANLDHATMPDGRKFEAVRKDPLLGVWDHPVVIQRIQTLYGTTGYSDVLLAYKGDLSAPMKYPEYYEQQAEFVNSLLYSNRISLLRPRDDY